MSLIAIALALLIEQVRPLPVRRLVNDPLAYVADRLAERLNDGREASGRLAWLLLAVVAVAAAWAIHALLWSLQPVLGFAFDVAVLYLTMGFRHESHFFTDIHVALRLGEIDRARELAEEWRGAGYEGADDGDIARLAIEQALVAAHRNVFGVIFWFVVLPGPAGAVLYRLAAYLRSHWGGRTDSEFGEFGAFARRAFGWIDWIPVRLTAMSFSVVGNFEDAVLCWRTQARQWGEHGSGILLASGAGALGVRLGLPIQESGRFVDRPEMGCGDDARVEFMQSTVGLVWRALCLCLVVLALMGLAAWVAG